jgi:hypothetical protein
MDAFLNRLSQQRKQLGIKEYEQDEARQYAVEIPGLGDVVHLIPKAKISKDEYEAHKRALRRKEPSPLSPRQLDTLAEKRKLAIRISQSPTPELQRNVGWYVNQVENVGDIMTGAYWGGRGLLWALSKIGLKTGGPAAKYMGWAMVGKDIADIINLFRMARSLGGKIPGAPGAVSAKQAKFFGSPRGKSKFEALQKGNLNPFSKESKLSRGFKLKAKLPGVPDWIEIAQVTDQLFGVGVSFGGIVGFASDLGHGIKKGAKLKAPWQPVKHGEDEAADAFEAGAYMQVGAD